MSKMKTKSSMKRRFRLTASGKIKRGHAGKLHFMRRRTKRFIRGTRSGDIIDQADEKRVKRLMPYG